MQALRSICGFPFFIVMALAGQIFAHFLQPMQSLAQSLGYGVSTWNRKLSASLATGPLPPLRKKTLACEGTVL